MDSGGYEALVTWAETHGRIEAFGIEGTGSYGAVPLGRRGRAAAAAFVAVKRVRDRCRAALRSPTRGRHDGLVPSRTWRRIRGMHALRRVRLPLPGASGVMWHYILAGVLLTLVWLLVRGLAPAGGLTRSFHYPLAPAANPLRLDIARIPAAEERAADVDLAFLDELRRPTRHYFGPSAPRTRTPA